MSSQAITDIDQAFYYFNQFPDDDTSVGLRASQTFHDIAASLRRSQGMPVFVIKSQQIDSAKRYMNVRTLYSHIPRARWVYQLTFGIIDKMIPPIWYDFHKNQMYVAVSGGSYSLDANNLLCSEIKHEPEKNLILIPHLELIKSQVNSSSRSDMRLIVGADWAVDWLDAEPIRSQTLKTPIRDWLEGHYPDSSRGESAAR